MTAGRRRSRRDPGRHGGWHRQKPAPRRGSWAVADQLSLLLDATGYRGMLRESRAETTEGRLENLQELMQLAGGFDTAREPLDHAALSTGGPDEEETGRVQLMTLHKAKGPEV